MIIPRRSFFGQQHLSGLEAAMGVFAVAVAANALFGFTAAAAAAAGAMCVSIVDHPAPTAQKLVMLLFAVVFVGLTTLVTVLSQPYLWPLGLIVMAISFFAALLSAYGRAVLPLGVSISLSMVLALGTPQENPAEAIQHTLTIAGGAAAYLVWAMIAARVLEPHNKALALSDCMLALAQCLRTQARFYDSKADLDRIYRTLIDRQAVLTERLQAARNLIYDHVYGPEDRRLVEAFFVVLDIFESSLSSQTDYRLLRRHFADADAFVALRAILIDITADLERLAQAKFGDSQSIKPLESSATLAPIDAAIIRLERASHGKTPSDVQALLALRTTFNKARYAVGQVERLHRIASGHRDYLDDSFGVDLSRFVQRPNFRPGVLAAHLTFSSPTFRYAARLALAMGCGFLLAHVLPYASHGNWILLTIALVMRANYSITKQRRTDRLIGNLLGCLISAAILHVFPESILVLCIFVSIGVAHAYAVRNYRIAATAACIMALLQIHALAPGDAPLLIERVLDTAVGAALAYLFSHVLPHWEVDSIPKLMIDTLKSDIEYVRQALQTNPDDLAYRLSRKRMLDAIATLSGTLSRMLDEPRSVRHRRTEALGAFLTANHLLASHLASVQMFFRNRAGQMDATVLEKIVTATRERTEHILESAVTAFTVKPAASAAQATLEVESADMPISVGDSETVIRRRLQLVASEAQTLCTLAQALAATTTESPMKLGRLLGHRESP